MEIEINSRPLRVLLVQPEGRNDDKPIAHHGILGVAAETSGGLMVPDIADSYDPTYRVDRLEIRPVKGVVVASPSKGFTEWVDTAENEIGEAKRQWRVPNPNDTVWVGISDWDDSRERKYVEIADVHVAMTPGGEVYGVGKWAVVQLMPKSVESYGLIIGIPDEVSCDVGFGRVLAMGDGFIEDMPLEVGTVISFKPPGGKFNPVCPGPWEGEMARIIPTDVTAIHEGFDWEGEMLRRKAIVAGMEMPSMSTTVLNKDRGRVNELANIRLAGVARELGRQRRGLDE